MNNLTTVSMVLAITAMVVNGESIRSSYSSNGIGGSMSYPGTSNRPPYPTNPQYPNNNNNNEVVAFTAIRASRYSQGTNSNVKFDRTITDLGYGWDSNSGEFKAYYSGAYVFSWSGVSPSSNNFRLTLMKNGLEVGQIWGDRIGYQSGANTVVLELNAGDRVYLRVSEGQLYEPDSSNRGYTTFSGYKLN
ncbi:hypothetical protein TCAL_09334 [Tigriopus californicus]|uniref:C1q domain-containing protein n=1 Tax=Tigriopus californicus TaxID=6832 RepID=A0A553PPA7_TIGCA|nr:C1q-related factor-like [Tigriopus californicus]TRY79514.1 hypothetical protein TCAL_09334 [Tigriopus californicus]|eukprot:TCALIF_09334-PA protein Name:"Similar to caprin2 Caprin-2 (Danio rerio)" AED:0.07 eAED:0.10 QI:0/-1/0/1/-1/1/1/0/189